MKVLLTGATGFIGGGLKAKLSQCKKYQVVCTKRGMSFQDLDELMSAFSPDLVVHLASYFTAEHHQDDLYKVVDSNIFLGLNLLEAMKKNKVRKIITTGSVWQNWQGDKSVPTNLYAASKTSFDILAKYFVSAEKFHYINLQLADTYGPRDPRKKLVSFLLRSPNHSELKLSPGDQWLILTHLDDVLAAIELAMNEIYDGVYTGYNCFSVASSEMVKLKNLVSLIENIRGVKFDAKFGAKKYRDREVMIPQLLWPLLPNWKAQVSLKVGLEMLVNEP